MDLYITLANWVGWPVVVALMFLGGTFGYWMLNKYIEILKEKVDGLEKENNNLKDNTPDVLAQSLARRHKMLIEELERLNSDNQASQETIKSKELEISEIEGKVKVLREQLEKIQILLSDSDLVCPHCGAPLITKEYVPDTTWFMGRDIDIEHEHITYECGLEFADGRVLGKCSNTNLPKDNPSR